MINYRRVNWVKNSKCAVRYYFDIYLKNVIVDPPISVPYLMVFWSAKSSADSIGVAILSTVKKAAKFAV